MFEVAVAKVGEGGAVPFVGLAVHLAQLDRLDARGDGTKRSAGQDRGGVSEEVSRVYDCEVVRRTNINLDMDLVQRAAHELGTERTTDTVHQALRDVITRARRTRLAERDFEDLTPEALEAMRDPVGRTA